MTDDRNWFAHKRYGYGASFPITWQGWALTIGFIALLAASSFLIRYSLAAYLSVAAILTTVFLFIGSRTTRGGWRWRWGEEE